VPSATTRVLVVDDDPGIRQMLELALREAGFDVAVSDGQRLEGPRGADVVLLDVRLGNHGAWDLLAEVPSLASVPIIVMTATVGVDAVARDMPGMFAVVAKPFDLDVLERRIREAAATRVGRD
jgi:two-component system, NtrC family, nitrogen regulation response regulator GlnG